MGTRLAIKVVPGASQNRIVGWLGEVLKVKVRAQPERGKANAAVISLLAKHLDLPRSDLTVFSGHTSRTKTIKIRGMSDDEIQRKLATLRR